MKNFTCEMCGSTDLIKQDGVFVCQACGCKYTVEEAKKMIVEGTVDVSGSIVKVDNTDELANLYQIARRARDDNNTENAAKYYEMILVKDPNSWEAAFYTVYFQTMSCKIGQIKNAAITLTNCEENVLKLVKATLPKENWHQIVTEIVMRCTLAATTLSRAAKDYCSNDKGELLYIHAQEYADIVCTAGNIMYSCGNLIESIFLDNEDIKKTSPVAWKSGINIHMAALYLSHVREFDKKTIMEYMEKIAKYDESMKKEIEAELEKEKEALEKRINKRIHSSTPSTTSSGNSGSIVGVVIFIILAIITFATR